MSVPTVNISFQEDLLRQIDELARNEARSRSELIREAARMYIEKEQRWQSIFSYGESVAPKLDLSEHDIMEEIKSVRNDT